MLLPTTEEGVTLSRRNWLWYVLSGSVLMLTAALGYAGWRQMELGAAGLCLPAYGRNLTLPAMLSPWRTVHLPVDWRSVAVPAMLSAAGLEVIAWMGYRR